MSQIQIKSYFVTNKYEDTKEVRRFDIDLNHGNIYEQLKNKLQSSYGALLPNKEYIHTKWCDDDHDKIGFSNDVEMKYAIDNSQDSKFKEYPHLRVFVSYVKTYQDPYMGKFSELFDTFLDGRLNITHMKLFCERLKTLLAEVGSDLFVNMKIEEEGPFFEEDELIIKKK